MTRKTPPFAKTLSVLACVGLASPALADRPGFASPSRNILCYIDTDYDGGRGIADSDMVCLIASADWSPPVDYGDDDPTCDLDATRILILPPDAPARERWVCHGDIFFPIHGAISYGSTWSFLDYTCDVATSGVRCTNANGNGFSVNRAGRTLN